MKIIISLFIVFSVPTILWASQQDQVREGNKFFKEKKWDESIDHYFNALEQGKHEGIVHYDLGTAFYKKQDYDQSIEHLQKVAPTKDKKFNSRVQYNLGNSYFQKGRTQEKENLDSAIDSMKKSLQSYEKSLNADSKDEDALYNQKVAQEEIERLEKKKQEQKSSNQQNKQDQKKDQNNQKNQSEQNKQDQKQKQDQDSPKQDEQKDKESKDKQQSDKQENNKDQMQKASDSKDQQNQSSEQSQQELEKKQAQDILKDYERDEAPKGLLNFMKFRKGEGHVDKDW